MVPDPQYSVPHEGTANLLVPLRLWLREKRVPIHRHTIWYYFGGMTLFLFTIQVVTGILLLLYYRPTAETAFESVRFIMAEVRFGWLIRSIHSWSANLMIFTLFVHMASVYLTRGYRAPRGITWMSGVALLLLVLGFGFSGYLLPWNKLAFFATQVGTQIVGSVPVVGSFVLRFLRGGENVTGATLIRFYGFHVAVLPALTTALLTLHLLLVQVYGMSTPSDYKSGRSMPFIPNFLLRDIVGWLLALATLAALAAIFPWELGEKADPFASAPKGIRPEWFFMWMFQTFNIVPAHVWIFEGERVAIAGFGLLLLAIATVPLVEASGRARMALAPRFFTIIGWIVLLYVLLMTVSGYLETPVFAAGAEQNDPDELFKNDIHNQRGVSCIDCHKDNPQPQKSEVAALCGRCHSDPNYMRRFNPQIRVDQFAEYQTSVHGMRNVKGDEKVATCTSCHSVHDIRAVRDPKSPVYPTQVASTCAKCHADATRMATYKIPTDQFEKYRRSVHAAALLDRHDLGAPTCNDCHGNHGARPPGMDSIPAVCGQCHRQEKDLFSKSSMAQGLQDLGLPGCVVCHENHEIRRTDDRLLSVSDAGVCGTCHSDEESKAKVVAMQSSILKLRVAIENTSDVLAKAERAGMEVSKPKFDLDQAHVELIKARVSVHAFSPDKISELTNPAMTTTAAARKSADAALEEVGFRRRGLGYALIAIGVTIVALLLKIREIERDS